MNKLFKSIVCVATGLAMAIGVGVVASKEAKAVYAEDSETITFSTLGYENGEGVSSVSGTNFTVSFTDGSTATAYYNTGTGIRVYGGGSFTVAPVSGKKITAATMHFSGTSNAPTNSQTVSVGTLSGLGTTTVSWAGNTTEGFTITRPTGSGHWRFQSITVTYDVAGAQLKATTTVVSAANNKTTLSLPSDSVQLSATVSYENGNISNPYIAWSGNNNAVATIDENGLVTAVGKGEVTFTATYNGDDTTYGASSGNIVITVINPNEVTFEAGVDLGSTSASGTADEVTKGDITIHCSNAAFATAEYRFYAGSTITITRAEGNKMESIVFSPAAGSYPLSNLSLPNGANGSYSNGTWTGAASSVTFNVGSQARASKVVVTYYTGADATLNKEKLVLVAGGASSTIGIESISGVTNPSYEWRRTSGDDCVTLSDTTSQTVTVAPKGLGFTSCVLELKINGSGLSSPIVREIPVYVARSSSLQSPFSVAEARLAIDLDESGYLTDAYAEGIISDAFETKTGIVCYNISVDGTQNNELEVFNATKLDGSSFASKDEITIGARVVVNGNLAKYNSTYEFAQGSTLISLELPGVEDYLSNAEKIATIRGSENVTLAENPTTITKTTNALVAEFGWSVSSGSTINGCYTSFSLDNYIGVYTNGLPNCGSIWGSSTNDWRLYQNLDGDVVITANSGSELVSVKFTYTINNTGSLVYNGSFITSGQTVELSGTSATFTVGNTKDGVSNGQVRITEFEVVYKAPIFNSIESLDVRFGIKIPTTAWDAIQGIEDYGVAMFLTSKEKYLAGTIQNVQDRFDETIGVEGQQPLLSIGRRASGTTPALDGNGNYNFSVRVNVPDDSWYDYYFCARPFVKINGVVHWLLQEDIRESVRSLADGHNNGTNFSEAALSYLAGN